MHKCSRRRSETPHQTRSQISLTWWWTNHLCRWFEELRRYLSLHLLLTDVRDYLCLWYFSPNSCLLLSCNIFLSFVSPLKWLSGSIPFHVCLNLYVFCKYSGTVFVFWILIDHFSLSGKQQPSLPIKQKVWKSRIHAFEFMSLLYNSSQGSTLKSLYRINRARGKNLFQHVYSFMCSFLLSHVFPELVLTPQLCHISSSFHYRKCKVYSFEFMNLPSNSPQSPRFSKYWKKLQVYDPHRSGSKTLNHDYLSQNLYDHLPFIFILNGAMDIWKCIMCSKITRK